MLLLIFHYLKKQAIDLSKAVPIAEAKNAATYFFILKRYSVCAEFFIEK